MSRSKWKGPYINNELIIKEEIKNNKTYVFPRNFEITPNCVGLRFKIHTGKDFLEIGVINEMIGHKFGEFAMTREKFVFKKKKKKK
jgi:ribosomal protein S19